INAVGISFKKIEEFREDTQQRLNAFGNTFVGIFKDNQVYQMDSHPDGYDTLDWTKMTFEVPGFEVKQNGETVAKATYGFYKYLHFDGDDGSFKDKNTAGNEIDSSGKVTPLGQEGGVGLKYWLASLEVLPGKTLLLTGLKEDSELDNASGSGLQELFTLSANLEGSGNVAIAEDSTVIIGTPKTIYNIDLDKVEMVEKTPDPGASSSLIPDATKDVPFLDAAPNQFTGQTTVNPGAVLVAGKDGSLGSTTNYSSKLVIGADGADRATFYLQSHTQTVGGLTIGHDSLVSLTKAAQIADLVSASDPIKVEKYAPSMGKTAGELTVKGDALIEGYLEGEEKSLVNIESGVAYVTSENSGEVDLDISAFYGTLALKNGAVGYLDNPKALAYATADVQSGSVLYFDTPFEKSNIQTRAVSLAVSPSQIGFIRNSGEIYLSSKDNTTSEINVSGSRINGVDKAGSYAGAEGSVIHYRGLVQGPDNSQVDVIHSQTATGTSEITFGNHKDLPPVGVFAQSQGEKTLKENGIPVFIVQTPTHNADDLVLTMDEFGVKAKDNEAYKWMYGLGYNEKEDGSREWVLYNSNTPDDEPTPIIPPSPSVDPDLPNVPVLRPESGAYIANSEAWAKMHMRLHDRFGQAYYIDPFDGEEKKASGWVRQVGTHSHFKAGSSKTHARTAITQVGADLIRNEANEDWKYVGGVFAGGLYNRANTRSWDSAKSRSDGYSLGIYGTIYTGNSPDDGFYVDSWLLFGRYDNKVWGDENPGFKYKSRGWVWSVESGYTIPLSESGTKDYNKLIWTFQPEVQVVWDGVRASSVVDNTGTKYTQLGKDNVSIRVGARLHANYMNKGLGFIEGNWIHNTKNPGVRMTNGDIYRNGGRNVGEFRMGLEGHLSRNTLGWATVGVQAGKSGYHNETAQIGLRYMF
ncbi:autotransporter family protein, partial [Turicimonas muris]